MKEDVERRERAQATVIENQAKRLDELETLYKVLFPHSLQFSHGQCSNRILACKVHRRCKPRQKPKGAEGPQQGAPKIAEATLISICI